MDSAFKLLLQIRWFLFSVVHRLEAAARDELLLAIAVSTMLGTLCYGVG